MQKIIPFLWFEKNMEEVAKFYTSSFNNGKIKNRIVLNHTPSGGVEVISIDLLGQDFTMMAAGPMFKFTPAVSFLVACKTKEEVDALWAKLSQGGNALMPLDQYLWSEHYGWLSDRYGVSWQIMFMGNRPIGQRIIPTLMFVGAQAGKAEDAMNFYASVFSNSKVADIARYGKEEQPDQEGTVKHARFILEGEEFAAMDSAHKHDFTFTEATSFEVRCESQEEVDYYWQKLTADPKAEQCGWLKDRYGLSWQIVPTVLNRMLEDKDPEKVSRVTNAFLQMKKFDIAALQRAYDGK